MLLIFFDDIQENKKKKCIDQVKWANNNEDVSYKIKNKKSV